MKKILFILLLFCMVSPYAFADINDWIKGDGTDAIEGADDPSDLDTFITNYLQDPLDRLLANYVQGCTLTYASTATITIGVGEVVCQSAGGVKRFRQNTSTVTISTATDLDAGAVAANTWYHIFAVADANATTFTCKYSTSTTTPTGLTYYAYLGSVKTAAASTNLLNFIWVGTGSLAYCQWDAPISVTTTVSSGAWSGATACSSAMPSTSNKAVFNYVVKGSNGILSGSIKPNGGTGLTPTAAAGDIGDTETDGIIGDVESVVDSSQQISHYEYGSVGVTSVGIWVKGFYIER